MDTKMGYLVKYSEKKGFWDVGERQEVIAAQSKLAEMLQDNTKYAVWSATLVNVTQYQLNHENKLEEWGWK